MKKSKKASAKRTAVASNKAAKKTVEKKPAVKRAVKDGRMSFLIAYEVNGGAAAFTERGLDADEAVATFKLRQQKAGKEEPKIIHVWRSGK